jgi:hypothetical protein
MFLFKSHKKFTHKQTSIVGFVIALMSILTMAVVAFGFPILMAWLNSNGVYELDLVAVLFAIVFFFSVQGLLLFGFPLFYATDKKSHMTGFQILLYALMWLILMMGIIAGLAVEMKGEEPPAFDIEQLLMELEQEVPADLPVEEPAE